MGDAGINDESKKKTDVCGFGVFFVLMCSSGMGMLMPDWVQETVFWVAFVNGTLMLPPHVVRALLITENDPNKFPTYFILMAPQVPSKA